MRLTGPASVKGKEEKDKIPGGGIGHHISAPFPIAGQQNWQELVG
jgi:hypothetical protein